MPRAPTTGSPMPPEDLGDPERVAAGYAAWVARTGYAAETRRAYVNRATAFCRWLEGNAHHGADEVFTDERARDFAVRSYRDHLIAAGRSPRGVDAAVGGALRLSTWAGLARPGAQVFPTTTEPATAPQHLDDAQTALVLRMAERRGSRELTLFTLAVFSGLRVGELHRLNVDDVHVQRDGGAIQVHGKGGRFRTVPVHPQQRRPLEAWARERMLLPGAREERALFLARGGARLATRSIHDLVRAVGRQAGIPDLHPHVLRHTCGRGLVRSGMHLRDVQAQLGHSTLASTAIYTAHPGRAGRGRGALDGDLVSPSREPSPVGARPR